LSLRRLDSLFVFMALQILVGEVRRAARFHIDRTN
jgi:hypothetical protein